MYAFGKFCMMIYFYFFLRLIEFNIIIASLGTVLTSWPTEEGGWGDINLKKSLSRGSSAQFFFSSGLSFFPQYFASVLTNDDYCES